MYKRTETKIKEIKKMIKENMDLKEIIKKKFNTIDKKDKWLKEWHENFTQEELTYLDYTITPELVEVEEIKEPTKTTDKKATKDIEVIETIVPEKEIKKEEINEIEEKKEKIPSQVEDKKPIEEEKEIPAPTPTINTLDFLVNNTKEFKSFEDFETVQDKLSFLLTDKVLKALFFMTMGQSIKNEAEATLKLNLENIKNKYSKNIKIKNIRINEELYKEFTDFCEDNKITIISALSCALEEFLEKYKDLKKNKE